MFVTCRDCFKVDSILEQVEAEHKKQMYRCVFVILFLLMTVLRFCHHIMPNVEQWIRQWVHETLEKLSLCHLVIESETFFVV